MELTVHVNDKVKLYTRTFIANHHYEIVYLLYQPLIGVDATSLYFTLWSMVNIEKGDLIISHRQLITFFNWNLNKLIDIRSKLEAIGLLTTYYNKNLGYYVYELKQPLSAKQYFMDSNLNVHLLYQVGDKMYEYLEKKFITRPLDKSLINISKNFTDLFQIIDDVKLMESDKQYITTTVNNFSLPLNYDFDFELFSLFLQRQFINVENMSQEVKDAIVKEAALYQFDAQMMSRIVLECTNNQEIDLDELHNTARNYYKRLKSQHDIQEIKPSMSESEFTSLLNKKRLTNKEKALKNYKTNSPIEWLSTLQGNTEVPNSMIEVVNELYNDYKLPGEVLNVLIEFVRVRNDGRLPKEYAKTIAASWVFNKIKTAEQAMEMVEKIQAKEKEYVKNGKVAPTYIYNRNKKTRVESEPDWLKAHQEYRESIEREKSEEDVNIDDLKKLLESFD